MLDPVATSDRWFWVKITLQERHGKPVLECMLWDKLPWHVRMKYDWYFKYRAALLQVQHPRMTVEMTWGSVPITEVRTLHKLWRDRVAGKKRSLTKCQNYLRMARENWTDLFPIEEYPMYQQAAAKVVRLEMELELLLKTEPQAEDNSE